MIGLCIEVTFFLEILIVREALLPYKLYLRNIDRLPKVPVVNRKPKTAKEVYVVFRNISTKDIYLL